MLSAFCVAVEMKIVPHQDHDAGCQCCQSVVFCFCDWSSDDWNWDGSKEFPMQHFDVGFQY